jgi:hypothetical protein
VWGGIEFNKSFGGFLVNIGPALMAASCQEHLGDQDICFSFIIAHIFSAVVMFDHDYCYLYLALNYNSLSTN